MATTLHRKCGGNLWTQTSAKWDFRSKDCRTGTARRSVDTGARSLKKTLKLLRLTVEKKRELVEQANSQFDTLLLCGLLGLARSSFYYTQTAEGDSWLRSQIERVCLTHHRRGYRRVTDALHRQGIIVNKKRVQRMMAEMGLQVRPRRKRVATTRSKSGKCPYPNLLKGLEITYPNQVTNFQKEPIHFLPH